MTTTQRSALHALLANPVDMAGDNIRAIRALLTRLDTAERLLGEAVQWSAEGLDIAFDSPSSRDFADRIATFYGDDLPDATFETLAPYLSATFLAAKE